MEPERVPSFPGVRFHQIDERVEPAFTGISVRIVDKDADFVNRANEKKQALRKLMKPYPTSCVLETIGKRETMEDCHVVVDSYDFGEGRLPGVSHLSYYAVYDGHGGTEAALMLQELLFRRILANLAAAGRLDQVEDVLRMSFAQVDQEILGRLGDAGLSIGATAVACLMLDKTLYIANVGDAEAVLGKKDRAKREFSSPCLLTKAHKANNAEEKSRVEKAEAMYVTCEPHIQRIELSPEDEFLVLACDGLWDRVSHDEACLFVSKLLRFRSLRDATEFLVEEALDRNTRDNVTVIVVNFGWSVDVSEPTDAAAPNLSPGFLEFLKKSSLISSADELQNSPVRSRISSPIMVTSVRKDFFLNRSNGARGGDATPGSGSAGASPGIPKAASAGSTVSGDSESPRVPAVGAARSVAPPKDDVRDVPKEKGGEAEDHDEEEEDEESNEPAARTSVARKPSALSAAQQKMQRASRSKESSADEAKSRRGSLPNSSGVQSGVSVSSDDDGSDDLVPPTVIVSPTVAGPAARTTQPVAPLPSTTLKPQDSELKERMTSTEMNYSSTNESVTLNNAELEIEYSRDSADEGPAGDARKKNAEAAVVAEQDVDDADEHDDEEPVVFAE